MAQQVVADWSWADSLVLQALSVCVQVNVRKCTKSQPPHVFQIKNKIKTSVDIGAFHVPPEN